MELKVENPKLDLETWITKYKSSYVSHAIWQDNLDSVFKDLKLMPSEALFRKNIKVSHENGHYSERRTIAYDLETEKEYIVNVLLKKFDSLSMIKELKVEQEQEKLSRDVLQYFMPLITREITKKDSKEEITKEIKVAIKNLKNLKGNEGLKFYDADTKHPTNWSLDSFLIDEGKQPAHYYRIIHDEYFSEMKLDKILSILIKNNLISLESALFLRHRELGLAHRLNDQIRCAFVTIFHSYGPVAVLMGDSTKYLSQVQPCKTHRPLRLEELSKKTEVFLKSPFENDGEFFNVSLGDDSVIVVGEKAYLQKYEQELKSKGVNYFFYEDMTKEQQDVFNYKAKTLEAKPVENNSNKGKDSVTFFKSSDQKSPALLKEKNFDEEQSKGLHLSN